MSDSEPEPELTQLLTDLTATLQDLEEEVRAERPQGPRLPTRQELSRFTSEVAIPGLILLLQTNIRALQLLQRTIRLANGQDPSPDGAVSEVRTRAEAVGRASLVQLDGVLTDLQSALEARPENEEADELLSRAQSLRKQVRDEIDESTSDPELEARERTDDQSDAVDIDIESELQSIKDNLDGSEAGDVADGNGRAGATGNANDTPDRGDNSAGNGDDATKDGGTSTGEGDDTPGDGDGSNGAGDGTAPEN